NLDHLDVVREVHEDYIRAGAQVVIANTYSAGRPSLEEAGLGDRVEEVNRAGVRAALEARERVGRPEGRVAGSMSRQMEFRMGMVARGLSREQLLAAYSEQASILADEGAELLVLEMISDPAHGEPAIEAALATGLPVWLGLSARRDDDGRVTGVGTPLAF